MTLNDLKSWWQTYSPIIKEAKKRNNLSLLNNYVNVYKSMIKTCREETQDEHVLKILKTMERSLEETLLDVTLEKKNVAKDRVEEQERGATRTGGDANTETVDVESFVERIRKRYGKGRGEEGTRDEGVGELQEGRGESREDLAGGVKFQSTFEEGRGGRRHEKKSTYHSDTCLDTVKKTLPDDEIVLDSLDRVIYNIEQYINENEG